MIFKSLLNIQRKTPVLESLFHNVAGLKVCNFIKERLQHRCFPVSDYKIFKSRFFIEQASEKEF